MGKQDRRVDTYIARAADFAKPILSHLRRVVHEACPEVQETMKWSFPHFMCHGILCSMAAFKEHCAFGFWKGDVVFAKVPRSGPPAKQAMGQFGRITRLEDLPVESFLADCIREAARLNQAGVKSPKRTFPRRERKLEIPNYFLAALKKTPAARTHFEKFSFSHQREYVEWVTEAKREETRQKRMATALEWIAKGKPRNWKYLNC
jgi:uncharacterized protein YdeI (YjbR/CyaY-like superfamily)